MFRGGVNLTPPSLFRIKEFGKAKPCYDTNMEFGKNNFCYDINVNVWVKEFGKDKSCQTNSILCYDINVNVWVKEFGKAKPRIHINSCIIIFISFLI